MGTLLALERLFLFKVSGLVPFAWGWIWFKFYPRYFGLMSRLKLLWVFCVRQKKFHSSIK